MKHSLPCLFLLYILAGGPVYAQGGALDLTFGQNGRLTTALPATGHDYAHAMAVLPDGKFLLAGAAFNGSTMDVAVARFLPDGAFDPDFGDKGRALLDFDGRKDFGLCMAVQPDGKILVAGYAYKPPTQFAIAFEVAVARFLPDGRPDFGFGEGGKAVTALPGPTGMTRVVLAQPDGHILVVAGMGAGGSGDIAMIRYRPDGTPDDHFGPGGIRLDIRPDSPDAVNAAALLPGGKFLLVGETRYQGTGDTDFFAACYLPDGTPDSSFAANGRLYLDFFGADDRAFAVAVQPDGNILLGGLALGGSPAGQAALARILPDGTPDAGFGVDGRTAADSDSGGGHILHIALQADGNILAVGKSDKGPDDDILLLRCRPDGALDEHFGDQGLITLPLGNSHERGNAVAALPGGNILAAGSTQQEKGMDIFVLQVDTLGNLSPGFGDGGIRIASLGYSGDEIADCLSLPDGRILAAGATNPFSPGYCLALYRPDGTPDPDFGNGGIVTAKIREDQPGAATLQPDGKIIVGGSSAFNGFFEFSLARFLPDGTPDSSFGTAGEVITYITADADMAHDIALQADGKILLAGYSNTSDEQGFILARYHPHGVLDNTFGYLGAAITPIGHLARAYSLALQPDGKAILAGSTDLGNNRAFALARYLSNGTLDPTFGSGGIVLQDFGKSPDELFAAALQPDGKLVAAGYSQNGEDTDFALTRYLPDGTPDPDFGTSGRVLTDFGADEAARALALLPDGRIVAGGFRQTIAQTRDFALACYLPDGSPDTTFGTGGQVLTDFDNGIDQINAIALQADGKIVAAGYTVHGTDRDFALARFLPGLSVGTLDFSLDEHSVLVYPNPIRSEATLTYTLAQAETISIRLLDGQGRLLHTFVEGQQQAAGDQQQRIALPDALPGGWYVLVIAGERGQVGIKILR